MGIDEAAGRLSAGARDALRRLKRSEFKPTGMGPGAETLLRLGLAELAFGDLALTGLGRQVADRLA